MKLFCKPPVQPLGYYIGLRDSTGTKSVANAVYSRVDPDLGHRMVGVYTNKAGDVIREPSLYTEKCTFWDALSSIIVSNQECFLMVDTNGNHWFVNQEGEHTFAGKMVVYLKEPSGDYTYDPVLNHYLKLVGVPHVSM